METSVLTVVLYSPARERWLKTRAFNLDQFFKGRTIFSSENFVQGTKISRTEIPVTGLLGRAGQGAARCFSH